MNTNFTDNRLEKSNSAKKNIETAPASHKENERKVDKNTRMKVGNMYFKC